MTYHKALAEERGMRHVSLCWQSTAAPKSFFFFFCFLFVSQQLQQEYRRHQLQLYRLLCLFLVPEILMVRPTTDTTVVYTPQIQYRHDRHVQDIRVCYGHDRRKMATHTNQTTTTNQP